MTVPDTIVCLKVVPRPEEVRVDPETLTLQRADVRSVINPADMNALETALALKDRYGGTVRLLAMGPPLFEDYLRVALAMGADEAYLLSDRALGGADTLATSYTLAAGARKIGGYDLILCGEESSDGATGQVPQGIAEWLDVPQITYATDVALIDSRWRLRATRELRGGHEVLVSSLPVVVSVKMRANEPRFMDMDRRDWAGEAPITVWSADDLDVDPEMIGLAGSPTVVAGTSEAERRERRRELLTGTPAEQARELLSRMRSYLDLEAIRGNGRSSAAVPNVLQPPGASEAESGATEQQSVGGAAASTLPDAVEPREIGQWSAPRTASAGLRHAAETDEHDDEAWAGRAELLDSDGTLIAQVLAELWKHSQSDRSGQWGGHIRTELGGGHLPAAGDYALRLETEAEGIVTKHGASMAYHRNGLAGEEVEVRGSGEPPF